MGKQVDVGRQEISEELKHRYRGEEHPETRTQLQALWQLRRGKRIEDAVEIRVLTSLRGLEL